MPPRAKGEHVLDQLVDADITPEHVESDVTDLTAVSIAALRGLAAPAPNRRLLDEIGRPRSNALGGTNPPGWAV
ncbi:hypothetical protein HY68_25845 [Streptomyces sp. AcH 505]|nr:hypothetical protein HY68_25845 [Streptomyces sp. AcH 505]